MAEEEKFMESFDFAEIQDVDESALTTPKEETPPVEQQEENEKIETDINQVFAQEQEEVVEEQAQEQDEQETVEHPDNTDESSSGTPFAIVFAETLMEQGALTDFDIEQYKKDVEKDGQDGAIIKLFEHEVEKNRTAIVDNYDSDYKEYLELKKLGIPKDEAYNLVDMKVYYDGIETTQLEGTESEELRKAIITEYYSATTQLEPSDIEDMVSKIVDSGEDEKYAKMYLPKMQKQINYAIQSEKQTKINQQQQQKQLIETRKTELKSTIDSVDEIIPGTKITKQTKTKLFKMLTEPQKVDAQNRPMNAIMAKRTENPTKFDVVLAYLINSGAFDGNWDKLEKNIETKASKRMKEHIERNTKTSDLKFKARPSGSDKTAEDNLKSMRF